MDLLDRGVYQAPWLGPNGELVLLAVRSDHTLLCPPVVVPHGASRIEAADRLQALLDDDNPQPMLQVI